MRPPPEAGNPRRELGSVDAELVRLLAADPALFAAPRTGFCRPPRDTLPRTVSGLIVLNTWPIAWA
jgi:hypothetical protein